LHQQEHAVFTAQAERLQAAGKAPDLVGQFTVGGLTVIIDQSRFCGSGGIDSDQVLGEVEAGGWWQDGRGHEVSPERSWTR